VVWWYGGTVVLWYGGTVVQWYCGTVVLWYGGTVVRGYCGRVVLWVWWYIASESVRLRSLKAHIHTSVACLAFSLIDAISIEKYLIFSNF